MEYIAHKTLPGMEPIRIQSVYEHLTHVALFSSKFGAAFSSEQEGFRIGLIHDAGKYQDRFQRRIRGEGIQVDHSTLGAKLLMEQNDSLGAMAVAGHHSGLPDYGSRIDTAEDRTLCGRLKRDTIQPNAAFFKEITPPPSYAVPKFVEGGDKFVESFYIRMLYSCLVDADFLDTEAFMEGNDMPRGNYESIPSLSARFQIYAQEHWTRSDTLLNQERLAIRKQCEKAAEKTPGLFSLTVPTGGGKTAASMSFALRHAEQYAKQRIIYVIPYTSIIEQNSDVFEAALGAENIIQHHSNVDFSEKESESLEQLRKRLAVENWDAPIIMTTAVQFLESLFANRSSRCRKLHNIANSVVIFDEAQMLPINYLRPCVAAIAELVKHYHVSAVLCTATQPALTSQFQDYGLTMQEICPEIHTEIFRRAIYTGPEDLELDMLTERLCKEHQALCVVNTRRDAEKLYHMMEGEGVYHLSTRMTPNHRRAILKQIRRRLTTGLSCRVISTSLIEAGVDVDFPTVYRELAGIDSIVQAAGRCNREGKHSAEESVVHIFRTSEKVPAYIELNIGAAEYVMARFGLPDNSNVVQHYFKRLYRNRGTGGLDEKQIMKALCNGIGGGKWPFKTVADRFKLIEEDTYTIYIPTDSNYGLLNELRDGKRSRRLMRRLGQDAVSVYPYQFKELDASGCLESMEPGLAILYRLDQYNQNTGLQVKAEGGCALFA